MSIPTGDPVDGLIGLGRWYLDSMRRHSAELCRRTTPLLTDQAVGLSYEEVRLCAQLDHAVYVLGAAAMDLLTELREWDGRLTAAQRELAGRLQTEYDEVLDG